MVGLGGFWWELKLVSTKFLIVKQLASGRKCYEEKILYNLHKHFTLDFPCVGMVMKISIQNVWCGGGG